MIWFVHRNLGPGTPISSAHSDHMPGYNDEHLDDTVSVELQAFLKPSPATPVLTVSDLAAALVAKGTLATADLTAAIGKGVVSGAIKA